MPDCVNNGPSFFFSLFHYLFYTQELCLVNYAMLIFSFHVPTEQRKFFFYYRGPVLLFPNIFLCSPPPRRGKPCSDPFPGFPTYT